jgi:hypothetical protein
MNINVKAEQRPDGNVRCKVECDGQVATLIFTGSEVMVEVPEPAQAST